MDSSLFPVNSMEEWRMEFKYDAETWWPWSSHPSELLAWQSLDRHQLDNPDEELRVVHVEILSTVLTR